MTDNILISCEPATGEELWRGPVSDVDAAVSAARRAWAPWAARALTERIALMRAFGNAMRRDADTFADLIARETGKPLWEARKEIDAVVAKVDISVQAYAERTGKKKFDSGIHSSAAVRHKPHGVMAVLGPFNFPAHLPCGHIIPALIAGNAVVFKPSEKTPAVGEALVAAFHGAGVPARFSGRATKRSIARITAKAASGVRGPNPRSRSPSMAISASFRAAGTSRKAGCAKSSPAGTAWSPRVIIRMTSGAAAMIPSSETGLNPSTAAPAFSPPASLMMASAELLRPPTIARPFCSERTNRTRGFCPLFARSAARLANPWRTLAASSPAASRAPPTSTSTPGVVRSRASTS